MLDIILGIFSSSGVGSIIGMVGSFLTKWNERKVEELKYKRELKMMDFRLKELEIENSHQLAVADKKMQKAQIEGEIRVEEAELSAFTESLKSQRVKTGVKVIDGLKGAMRPIITVYLLTITSLLTYYFWELVDGVEDLPKAELLEILKYIIFQMIALTSLATAWWFGSRPSSVRKYKE